MADVGADLACLVDAEGNRERDGGDVRAEAGQSRDVDIGGVLQIAIFQFQIDISKKVEEVHRLFRRIYIYPLNVFHYFPVH